MMAGSKARTKTPTTVSIHGETSLPKDFISLWIDFIIQYVSKLQNNFCIKVLFVSNEQIKILHRTYCGVLSNTDCITTKHKVGRHTFGYVYVCNDTAKENATRLKSSLEFEIMLYVLHSLLHLCDYVDHNLFKTNMQQQTFYIFKAARTEKLFRTYITLQAINVLFK